MYEKWIQKLDSNQLGEFVDSNPDNQIQESFEYYNNWLVSFISGEN